MMTTCFGTRTLLPTLLPALLPPRLLIPAPQPRPGRQPSPAQFGSLNTSSRAIIKKIKDVNEAFKVLGLLMVFSNGVSVRPSSH